MALWESWTASSTTTKKREKKKRNRGFKKSGKSKNNCNPPSPLHCGAESFPSALYGGSACKQAVNHTTGSQLCFQCCSLQITRTHRRADIVNYILFFWTGGKTLILDLRYGPAVSGTCECCVMLQGPKMCFNDFHHTWPDHLEASAEGFAPKRGTSPDIFTAEINYRENLSTAKAKTF